MSEKLRVVFKKGEGIRYIGHLDILRTFVRGLRRAGIPIKYSEGFNPHAVMTFILPMGVGVTSECEIVDITLKQKISEDMFISKLNQNMPEDGIRILNAKYTEDAMPVICKAEYITDVISDTEIDINEVKSALSSKEIIVDKKSKKQNKQVNLMEHIFDSEVLSCEGKNLKLRMLISAGNKFNVKPTLVINGIASEAKSLNPAAIMPHRTKFVFE